MGENLIQVSEYDKLWLKEVYRLINLNERPTYRFIRAKLHGLLPKEFNPEMIDERLTRYRGEEIMLLGVNLVDPKRNIIEKSNAVVNAIRNLILADPTKKEVSIYEISNFTKFVEDEVSLILRLISPYGQFWSSASGNPSFQYGYSSINLEHNNQIFDEYLYFTNIEDYIEKSFDKKKNESKAAFALAPPFENQAEEVRIRPIFNSKVERIDPKLCFVLMPFKQPWSNEIFMVIKSTIESIGYQCLRADNLNGAIVMEDIWVKINQSAFLIADVTDKNPNVMYEVGIAHTVGKPTILLTQKIQEIPFDFSHLRHIEYRNSASGGDELRVKLKEAISSITETTV